MSSLRPDLREVRIKHMVYGVPEGRTEVEIESKRENYLWRIYIEGDPEALQRVQKVVYKLHPSFSNRIIETDDWRNNFEYRIFGYGSIE